MSLEVRLAELLSDRIQLPFAQICRELKNVEDRRLHPRIPADCMVTLYPIHGDGGCLKGTTARIVCDYLDFARVDKRYFLYDLFDHSPDQQHPRLPGHGPELLPEVRQRFAHFPNVNIVPGLLPDVLHQTSPEQIAFLHIDLNSASAEVGCLERLFDRLSPGAILILDDYGWSWGIYKAQKFAEDPFFEARGYHVLELPTGQGVVIK